MALSAVRNGLDKILEPTSLKGSSAGFAYSLGLALATIVLCATSFGLGTRSGLNPDGWPNGYAFAGVAVYAFGLAAFYAWGRVETAVESLTDKGARAIYMLLGVLACLGSMPAVVTVTPFMS